MSIGLTIYTYGTLSLFAVGLTWYIISDIVSKRMPYIYAKMIRDQDEIIKQLRHENSRYKSKYGKLPPESTDDA